MISDQTGKKGSRSFVEDERCHILKLVHTPGSILHRHEIKAIRYTIKTHPKCDSRRQKSARGKLCSFKEIAKTKPPFFVNRSPIWYGFRAVIEHSPKVLPLHQSCFQLAQSDDKPETKKTKTRALGLSYLINENPPWYICLLLGFQVSLFQVFQRPAYARILLFVINS